MAGSKAEEPRTRTSSRTARIWRRTKSLVLFFSALVSGIAALITLGPSRCAQHSRTDPAPETPGSPETPNPPETPRPFETPGSRDSDGGQPSVTPVFDDSGISGSDVVEPVSTSVDLAYPDSSSRRVGEVVVSLAFNSYGDSRRYELGELTAQIAGAESAPVFLDQTHPARLEGRLATYLITVDSLNTSARTARVQVESSPR